MSSDWQPTAGLAALRQRAQVLRDIRAFFAARDVLEVETPALCMAGNTDPALAGFQVQRCASATRPLYLHTSPEFAMKRLLAAGAGDIYQICKVFRDGEAGRRHNPEFTLLEWYRTGWDHRRLMDEVLALVSCLAGDGLPAVRRYTYRDLFRDYLSLDPFTADVQSLADCARDQGVDCSSALAEADVDGWLDLLLSHCIEPRLGEGLVLVTDYPASQAALARIRSGDPPVAERFELYWNGMELANGFHELTDARQQGERFAADNARRRASGLDEVPVDRKLLAALAAGMPACAGVALGVDRLLMLLTGNDHIDDVLGFPLERA